MNDKNLIRRCKALAAHACANWRDHECLARECPCDMANPRYATIHDGAISCDYFLSSVLPLDKELNRLVWCSILVDEERTQPNIRFCTVCGSAFSCSLLEMVQQTILQRLYYHGNKLDSHCVIP